ncbi:outer membrane beta-barrel protein [Vibrio nigripulchritudo]|uniref:outer membrane beta-barrel protein n=1 Tax=Vibrio nigripulchritudo TaxID=28173 RepID=UPI00066B32BF|nr:outer membrane beta-barrel protein [Vibrio nigripulchritudo]
MKKLQILILGACSLMATSTLVHSKVHETYLHGSSIYLGGELVVLSHDKEELNGKATSNHVELKFGKEFKDGHHVELYYLLPSDIDDTAARFKSVGARYAKEFDLDRRWKLMPFIGFGQNTFSAFGNSDSEWDLNYGVGVNYVMLDRSTAVGFGVKSYDTKADHLSGFFEFKYHF